ncbi:MAG: 2-amino-4-hydroxy-6-hydroxymethyldihydropteridine diphosphokinase [Porphyromonas sp.]|nr:2-amino-4-hydroxy-6-hydroxymethyldihydropteridine diphosphokinase [Porphyromonas sp.]
MKNRCGYNTKHQKKNNAVLISLGSNFYASRRIEKAVRLLRTMFSDIRFSSPICSAAVDSPSGCPAFVNRLAVISTDKAEDDCRDIFKGIEQDCGRLKYPKTDYRVSIDIDLLVWNTEIRKESDMLRPYVCSGIVELNYELPGLLGEDTNRFRR